jgi:hypothetical protein
MHVGAVADFVNVFIPIGLVKLFKTMTEIVKLASMADRQQIKFLSPPHLLFHYVILYALQFKISV